MDRWKDILPFLSAILSQHEFDVEVYSVLVKLMGSVLMSHRFSQSCDMNQLNTSGPCFVYNVIINILREGIKEKRVYKGIKESKWVACEHWSKHEAASGFLQGSDLSWAAQSGLGMLSMLGMLCVCASLLPCWSAESGLRLGAGSLHFCWAGGTGRALIHRGFRSEKITITITPLCHNTFLKQGCATDNTPRVVSDYLTANSIKLSHVI